MGRKEILEFRFWVPSKMKEKEPQPRGTPLDKDSIFES